MWKANGGRPPALYTPRSPASSPFITCTMSTMSNVHLSIDICQPYRLSTRVNLSILPSLVSNICHSYHLPILPFVNSTISHPFNLSIQPSVNSINCQPYNLSALPSVNPTIYQPFKLSTLSTLPLVNLLSVNLPFI